MRLVLLSSVCLSLIACSPPPATEGAKTDAAAAAAAPPAVAAAAMTIRPGRWKKVMTVMGRTTTEYECVTSDDINDIAQGSPNSECTSQMGFHPGEGGLVYEATCNGEGGSGTMRTVMRGDMQNAYVADSTMTMSGGPSGPMTFQMHLEGAYEGACRGDE